MDSPDEATLSAVADAELIAGNGPAPVGILSIAAHEAHPRVVAGYGDESIAPLPPALEEVEAHLHAETPVHQWRLGPRNHPLGPDHCTAIVLEPITPLSELHRGSHVAAHRHRGSTQWSAGSWQECADYASVAVLDRAETPVFDMLRQAGLAGDRPHYHPAPGILEAIDRNFTYHPPKGDQPERYERIRQLARTFALDMISLVPPGDEQLMALTRLEEVVFYANAAIARGE